MVLLVAFSLKLIKSKNPFKGAQALLPQVENKVSNANEAVNGLLGLNNFAIESLLGPSLLDVLKKNRETIATLLNALSQVPQSLKTELLAFLEKKDDKRFAFKVDVKALSDSLNRFRDLFQNLMIVESVLGTVLAFFAFLLQAFVLIALYAKVPPKTFLTICLLLMLISILFTAFYTTLICSASVLGSACESESYASYKMQIKECMATHNLINVLRYDDFGICERFDLLKCNLPQNVTIKQDERRLVMMLPNNLDDTIAGARKFLNLFVEPQVEQIEEATKAMEPLIEQAKSISALLPFNVSSVEDAIGNAKNLNKTINDKLEILVNGNLKTALECKQIGTDAQEIVESTCNRTLRILDELHSVVFLIDFVLILQTIILSVAVWIASKGKMQKFPSALFTSFFE